MPQEFSQNSSFQDDDPGRNHRLSAVEQATPYDSWQVVMLALMAGCTSLVTIGGNLIVIMSFFLERSIRVPSNYFIASLAVSDLLIGVCSMPLYTTYILSVKVWPLGEVLCDLWLSIDYTACLCSIYTVFCITVDRFCSIKLPAKYRVWRTERKVITIVCITWIIPISVFFTSIMGWQYFAGKRTVAKDKCYVQYMEDALFNCLLQVGYFWITLTAMFVLYSGIYKVALDLHKRSEAKRKQQISCLTTMAQKTVGQLGTAVITMTRNPKLDAACLASNRPSSLSPLMKDSMPWDTGVGFGPDGSEPPGSKGNTNNSIKNWKIDDEINTDSDTDSSQEERIKNSELKVKKKKEKKRRKSLLGLNDFRSLIPKSRQFLELPRPVVEDWRPASIAVCDRESDSDMDCSLKPIYTKQFERKCSRDWLKKDAIDDLSENRQQKSLVNESKCTEGEITLQVPSICSRNNLESNNEQTSNEPTNDSGNFKVTKYTCMPIKAGNTTKNPIVHPKRQIYAAGRYLRETCMSLDQGLSQAMYSEDNKINVKELYFKEKKAPVNTADNNSKNHSNQIKPENKISEVSKQSNKIKHRSAIPTICFTEGSPVRCSYQSGNDSGFSDTHTVIQNDLTSGNFHPMQSKNDTILESVDSNSSDKKSIENEETFDDEVWVLAPKSSDNSESMGLFDSNELKESCFGPEDFAEKETGSSGTSEDRLERQERKLSNISNLSTTTSITPYDTISVKTITFDLSPFPADMNELNLTKEPIRSKSTQCLTPCRLKPDDNKQVTSTPRHSISPSSSAIAFWNLISRATRLGSADPTETAEQRRHRKQQKKYENRARKALRTITIILGAFVFCWTPWHVLSMIMGFCGDRERCVAPVLYDVSYWLCYLNSPINPFCYAFANHQFKKTFIRILKLDWRRS